MNIIKDCYWFIHTHTHTHTHIYIWILKRETLKRKCNKKARVKMCCLMLTLINDSQSILNVTMWITYVLWCVSYVSLCQQKCEQSRAKGKWKDKVSVSSSLSAITEPRLEHMLLFQITFSFVWKLKNDYTSRNMTYFLCMKCFDADLIIPIRRLFSIEKV